MKHQTPQAIAKPKTETLETIKDAVGVFAILTMLYVGLFIPTL